MGDLTVVIFYRLELGSMREKMYFSMFSKGQYFQKHGTVSFIILIYTWKTPPTRQF